MLPVLVRVVVKAEEVLGVTERGELVSTGDKAVSPTAGSGDGRGVGCTHGDNWHRQMRNADLHPLPIPLLLRHHSCTFQKPFLLPPGLTSRCMLALCSLSAALVKAESRAIKLGQKTAPEAHVVSLGPPCPLGQRQTHCHRALQPRL